MKKIARNILTITSALWGSFIYAGTMGAANIDDTQHWTRFYVGGNLGSAWSSPHWTYLNSNPYDAIGPGAPIIAANNHFSLSNLSGGAQLGFNYQFKWLVFGPEVAFFWSDLSERKRNAAQVFPTFEQTVNIKMDKFFTATGRVGALVHPSLLIYGKGGYANTKIYTKGDTVPAIPGLQLDWNTGKQHNGWVAGGGAEWMVMNNLTLGIEYNYLNFNKFNHTGAVSGGIISSIDQIVHRVDASSQNIMARVNVLFGSL